MNTFEFIYFLLAIWLHFYFIILTKLKRILLSLRPWNDFGALAQT